MTRSNIRKLTPALQSEDFSKLQPQAPVVTFDSTASLADQKYELSRIRQQLDEELARIDAELKHQLQDGEVAYSRYGVGYRLGYVTQDVYDDGVIRELSRMRLLPKFVRVSTTRLRELVQDGRLSQRKLEALRERFSQPREIPTLREVSQPAHQVHVS